MKKILFLLPIYYFLLQSCSTTQRISKQANQLLLKDSAISTGHIGISIFDPSTGKYLYDHNGTHYFIPASNTKLATCYAAMKYLGDSLKGMRYSFLESKTNEPRILLLNPTGDPTFLHQNFSKQPLFDFLIKNKDRFDAFTVSADFNSENPLGYGWSWDDYNSEDMAERSIMPIFGNVINMKLRSKEARDKDIQEWKAKNKNADGSPGTPAIKVINTIPSYFEAAVNANEYLVNGSVDNNGMSISPAIALIRNRDLNEFWIESSTIPFSKTTIPFVTKYKSGNKLATHYSTASAILADTLKKDELTAGSTNAITGSTFRIRPNEITSDHFLNYTFTGWKTIHSQPTDSMLKPMMHVSDNFFAEQSLLMVSNEKLGYMKDAAIIDTLLKTDLKGLPQRPRWVDGCGLSRYNLFSPRDFVFILDKMRTEFGLERLKNILPTGGEGTFRNYYKHMSGSFFAKTGTLSNNCAVSGYLITKKGKLLIFSVLANNYITGATPVRRAVERFITYIRDNY